MKTLDRLTALLEMREIFYRHDRHSLTYTARETARADHLSPRTFAKVVVVHSEDGYAMSVLPADRVVDLEELRTAFGSQHLRLATEKELQELFHDCELGAMPPFGNGILYEMPVWVDGLLMSEETICFNAGTHRDVIQMNTEDWEDLVRPSVLAFAHAAG
ncbi:MAG: YbaK/EbsC family protein [Acidobacteria bacterium]|nr:YbaK/EbsC family protein [Acidobacteriota bacterium]